jgi:N-acetylglucosaminyldiphosphoundecaprenol N-acetyl-beta-D-mannosaminyltransferase
VNSYDNAMCFEDLKAPASRRINVLGVGISAIDMNDALRISDAQIRTKRKGYVCITGVHGVIEAQADPEFQRILNRSLMTTPDGMPMVWIGRIRGLSRMRRVYGPDFMMNLCRISIARGYRHFLFGGRPGVAAELAQVLSKECPGLQIAGTYTPPYRPLSPVEEADLISIVAQAEPDVFWVSLSTPKQERFMAQYLDKLNVKLMVGVGAAFDIHTGAIKDAPPLVKKLGLQWLHRLVQEPRRLWRRYLFNNPKFIWNAGLQFLGLRKFPMQA